MTNQVVIVGTIIAKYQRKNGDLVVTMGLTRRKEKKIMRDYPQITFRGEVKEKFETADPVEFDKLSIVGKVRTYRLKPGVYMMEVVATDFEIDKTGTKRFEDKNDFIFEGMLTSAYGNETVATYTLDISSENERTYPQVVAFTPKPVTLNSIVRIRGSVQTRKYTDKDGKQRTGSSLVASTIKEIG